MKTETAIENDVEEHNIVIEGIVKDAADALQVLGYARKDIEMALEKIDTNNLSVEDIIKLGLKNLS